MGKGSLENISLNSLGWELLHQNEYRQMRIDILKSQGYEVCRTTEGWFYRQSGTNNSWTAMDKK